MYEARICLVLSLHAYPQHQLWGSPTLLRHASAARIGSVGSPEGIPLVPRIGIVADTAVPEYQPVVHRLRLSASP